MGHMPLLQSSSLEDWGSPETPFSLPNTEGKVLGGKHEDLGILGTCEVLDAWHWPADFEHDLFPASRRDSRKAIRGKDVVARGIRDARKTVRIPYIPDVHPDRIRSQSGRHRCIHDMQQHNAEREVGKKYARVRDDGVYQTYGRRRAQQAGKKLKQNQELHMFRKNMYALETPAAQYI